MVGALVFFANIGVTLFIAVWLQRSGMAGPALAGLILTIPGIVGIVASPLAGMLGDRWGILKAASVGIALVLIARAGIFSAPEILWLYPSLLLLTGTGSALLGTNIGALSVSLWPNLRRAVAGIASGSRFFGFAMAPLLLTPVYEATSIRGVLVVTGVAILIATVLLRRIRPKQ